MGKSVSVDHNPVMKCPLKVLMSLYAALRHCIPVGASWKSILFSFSMFCKFVYALLSSLLFKCVVVCFLGGEVVAVDHPLVCQGRVCRHQVDYIQSFFQCCLCQVGKHIMNPDQVVHDSTGVSPLEGGLLIFAQVELCFDGMVLEFHPRLSGFCLGPPGATVFM